MNEPRPSYFGPAGRLFGVHHPPAGPARKTAVTFVHPLGEEYFQAYPFLLRLAYSLAEAGFHVFRFDCTGCGDSGGDFEDGSLARWTEDIAVAAAESRDRGGCVRVCLLGMRLGADLAAAAAVDDTEGIVLWDPVVDGAKYLEELLAAHDAWARGTLAEPPGPIQGAGDVAEILGFPFTAQLRREIGALDSRTLARRPASRALVLVREGDGTGRDLAERLRDLGTDVSTRPFQAVPGWLREPRAPRQGLELVRALRAAADWIREEMP